MCGRYTYKLTWEEIVTLYRLTLPEEPPEGLREGFNVAPTHLMPIIRPAGNGRELTIAKWGLVSFWSKARAGRETVVLDDQRPRRSYPVSSQLPRAVQAAAPSTAANHDRMPVVLEESQFEDWMRLPPEAAAELMKPHAGEIDVCEVPKEVGNVRNNRPELMERGVTLAGGIVGSG